MGRRLAHELDLALGPAPLPFFAEYAYLIWGEVNYDSDGDCSRPTDREWKYLELSNRATDDAIKVTIETDGGVARAHVSASSTASAELAGYLTALRTQGPLPRADASLVEAGLPRADQVAAMFLDPALAPFDSVGWWGGWKWCSKFATDMTSGLREVMYAVQHRVADPGVVRFLRTWDAKGPAPFHAQGVRYALDVLTPLAER